MKLKLWKAGNRWMAVLLFFSLAGPFLPAQGQNPPGDLDYVLQKMEENGSKIKTFTAQLSQKKYMNVLQEFDTEEKGMFYYARSGDGFAMIRKEIQTPSKTIAIINKDQGLLYHPSIKQAQKLSLGQHRDKAEFMAVGIGQSSQKLRDTFHLKFLQHELLDGIKTAVIEMRPKSEKTAAFLTVITLWMDEQNWIPIQSKLQELNEDYLLTRFTNVKINSPIPDSTFSLRLPADVEVLSQEE
jgi:outer membrane lipoprotein-sorting protein